MENNININKPLLEIVYQISSSLNFQVILNKINEEQTLKYLSTKRAAIYLLDKDKEFLEPVATFDPSNESQVMSEKINVISSLSGKVVKAKKGMIFNNASKIQNAYQIPGTPDDEDEHLMVLPLLFETEILGTLNLYRRSKLYSQEDLEFATIFAMYAGVAIQNAQEHQSLVREIEERKQAEEKLKDSEEKYRTLFDNMSNGFALHKIVLNENKVPIDYTFIEVNDAFENLTGLVRKNIIGNNVTEIIPGIEKDTTDWIGIYGKVALTQKSIQFENFAGPLNKWYSVNVYSPKKGYFATIFEDITEKKQNEEELLASVKDSQRFRKALDMVPAFVYLKDTQSRYLYANQSTLELFGVSAEELVGYEDSKFFPPKTVKHLHQIDSRVFLGEQTDEEIESKDAHGERQVYLEVKTPLYSETKKEIVGLLGISTDITERILAEEKLKSRNKELEIWAEVTTDRELFMLDLKKEINELLEKSSEKPKYEIPI